MSYFVAVVRAGSIRGAAQRLSISPAVVSEALSELEGLLDVTLLRRTTRSMDLTKAGRKVFEPAAEMLACAETAIGQGRAAAKTPIGVVRLTISGELCLSWLPEKLHDFTSSSPAAEVEVDIEDSAVDLASSDYDLAVRAAFSADPFGVDDAIEYVPLELVCSPSAASAGTNLQNQLAEIGLVGSPSADLKHRLIISRPIGSKKRRPIEVSAPCRFRTKDHVAAHRLAVEGFGAALLMAPTVADDLNTGRLVRVNESYAFGFAAIKLLTRDRHPTAATRRLLDYLCRNTART
ncbi:MAG: LysR family transcriptional regulator [Hyphomicrobiaceae bacterium]